MRVLKLVLLTVLALTAGCTGDTFLYGAAAVPEDANRNTDLDLGIAIVQPSTVVTVQTTASPAIQWADIASLPGTVVRVQAQREAVSGTTTLPGAFTSPVIHLVGDGTPGSGRDALGDGDNDIFTWDLTGVRIGDYLITATIEAPDGTSKTVKSHDPDRGTTAVIRVTTTLPVPALTFTAPGAADVTVTTGNTFNITWTDNGNNNADALVTLALDPDEDNHSNGNEIILLLNDPLSSDGNNGSFTFNFLDQDGNLVADGTYTVFALVDDSAHDVVTSEATGKLILNP